jgi:hypothetical protein
MDDTQNLRAGRDDKRRSAGTGNTVYGVLDFCREIRTDNSLYYVGCSLPNLSVFQVDSAHSRLCREIDEFGLGHV